MRKANAGKLNTLEQAIVAGEDSVEDARWAQAEEVVRLLDSGMTQREVAADWINGRTGKPYSAMHVSCCKRAWDRFVRVPIQDRPTWNNAYETVRGGSDEIVSAGAARTARAEASVPTSEETAEKFVQNLIKDAPETVKDTIRRGLIEANEDKYVTPADRKARRAAGHESVQPLIEAVDNSFGKLSVVQALEEATEDLRKMVERQSISADTMHAIDGALEALEQEADVARAMAGVEAA